MSTATFILTFAMMEQGAAPPSAAPAPVRVPAGDVQPVTVAPAVTPASAAPVRASSGPVRRVDANAAAGPLRDELEIVDAGTEDVGALGTSLREPAHDARLPSAFQRVYRVPGETGKLMRGNGALFAVFPESVYRRTARGVVPVAPPGTVFHIGMPGELHLAPLAPRARVLAPGQIDGRVASRIVPDTHVDAARVDARVGSRNPPPSDAEGAAPVVGGARTQPLPPSASVMPIAPSPGSAESTKAASADVYAHLGFGPARVHRD